MRATRSTAVAVVCLLLLTSGVPARAQDQAGRVTGQGFWAPFEGLNRWRGQATTSEVQISPAEHRSLDARMRELYGFLSRDVPDLAPPKDWETHFVATVKSRLQMGDPDTRGPIRTEATALLFAQVRECDACPIRRGGEAEGALYFWFNDVEALLSPWSVDSLNDGPRWYTPPRRTGEIAGFDVYDRSLLVLTRDTIPLWLPVAREDVIRYQLRIARNDSVDFARRTERTPSAELAAIRTDMEAAVRQVEATDPTAGRTMRAEMEATLREVERSLSGTDATAGEERATAAGLLRDRIAALESELAGLTTAQRAAPAYVLGTGETDDAPGENALSQSPSGTTDDPRKGSAVVVVNPVYTRPAAARDAVRLVVVRFSEIDRERLDLGVSSDEQLDVQRRVWLGADWNRLASVVLR